MRYLGVFCFCRASELNQFLCCYAVIATKGTKGAWGSLLCVFRQGKVKEF